MQSIYGSISNFWKRPIYIWKHPETEWLFRFRFGRKKRMTVRTERVSVHFETSSQLAKKFFFLNYQDGRAHESSVISILERKCHPKTCFLDIGAYLGTYTIITSKLCPDGSVHAFEMDPLMAAEINRSAALNQAKNITLICAVAWDCDGKVFGFEPSIKADRSTNSVKKCGNNSCLSIASVMIDSYCNQYSITPDMAKIDVEGAEMRVLRGMRQSLAKINTLFLEVHPQWLSNFGDSLEEIEHLLKESGFSVTEIRNHKYTHSTKIPLDTLENITNNTMLLCEKK